MPRVFLALALPDPVRRELNTLCYGLPGARWVPEANFHLNLRFIGEVDGAHLADIEEAMSSVATDPFEIQLKGLGTFPPRGAPRILWVGILPCAPLLQLKKRIERALQLAGFDADPRKYAPHVTLARFNQTSPGHMADYLSRYGAYGTGRLPVREFLLLESTLTRSAPHYTALCSFPLD